jgi:hypothetical protein
MNTRTVMVLTSKSFETMIAEGGSGNWRANEESVRRCSYVVAVRNRHTDWSQGLEDHGTAFLIGRVVGVKPSPKYPERIVIQFDRFATLDKPNSWPTGIRNPVSYSDLDNLGIDPEKLDWQEFPGYSPTSPIDESAEQSADKLSPAEVIDRAKEMIARSMSIPVSAVKISIQV